MRLPDPELSRAVLIGTTKYTDPEAGGQLPVIGHNIADLVDVLVDENNGGFRREHCAQLVDESNSARILERLDEAVDQAQDVLLVYIAAHALPRDPDANNLYIYLPGTDTSKRRWWQDALSYDDVRETIRQSTADNTIVIVDTCFAGRALRESLGGQAEHLLSVKGAYTLTAVGKNYRAVALHSNERNTAFTGTLLELLSTGIEGQGEMLSLPKVFPHLRKTLIDNHLPSPHQHMTDSIEHLALVRNRANSATWSLPEQVQQDLESETNTVRAQAVRELSAIYRTGSPAVQAASRAELTKALSDDSKLVSSEASRVLNDIDGGRPTQIPITLARRRQPDWWAISTGLITALASGVALWWSGWYLPHAVIAGAAIGVLSAIAERVTHRSAAGRKV
ncbi:Caspase domain-containing protein [Actinokineospora diospyrosa]|uniref:Caspase domain-containing protein n=2 Tax=Actinokineospora diospyrosa TaxID=103728 RepID=A0ABT1IDB4_9PSEU|nr:Caspase domain-containing protein [Actinokineospora diospyrosa]